MTTLRPEHDAGQGDPYEREAYEEAAAVEAALQAAVGGLADPLNDPLPGQERGQLPGQAAAPVPPQPRRHRQGPQLGPQQGVPQAAQLQGGRHRGPQGGPGGAAPAPATPAGGPAPAAHAAETLMMPSVVPASKPPPRPAPPARDVRPPSAAVQPPAPGPGPGSGPASEAADPTLISGPLPLDDETMGLRTADLRRATAGTEAEPPPGGRAERRRAAKGGRGRRRVDSAPVDPESGVEGASAEAASSRPLSRVEARRAARAAKDSPAVVVSRVVGELFITFGVLMLLFVTYQLWWTNIRADQYAGKETNKIQDSWAKGRQPGAFEPGQGFAIMHIPKLDVVVPIAEGISKPKVLDHGMVGHYGEGKLKTAMPEDKQGNFSVAGHRNTHGEPFRYINRLQPGDKIIVETQAAYYTYEMTKSLPQTSPSNVSVIAPVPPGSGFTGPGRYITLTTCTPEFTSTYRLIVWGKMVDERPRSEGKPDALVG